MLRRTSETHVRRKAAVAGAVVCALAVTVGSAGAGPWQVAARGQEPPAEPKEKCDPEPGQVKKRATRPGEPLCGSRAPDLLRVSSYGNHVMQGYQSADVFMARNGKEDEIWGGGGRDVATIDSKDVVHGDVEVCKPIACPRAGSRTTIPVRRPNGKRTAHVEYPVYRSRIECRRADDGTRIMEFLHEPQLRAVDETPRADWQTVAWSPVLYRLEGSGWVEDAENIWLWDRTNDVMPVVKPHENWWRRYTGKKERWFVWFEPTGPGTYQIRLRYHWYKTARSPAYGWEDDAESVDPHYSSQGFEAPDGRHKSCVFP